MVDAIWDNEDITGVLTSFVTETRSEAIPRRAVETANLILLDTIGVALAASRRPIGRIISDHAAEAGGKPEATILGRGRRVPVGAAALANGTLANAIDFDEGTHISTHVIPAALAIAESEGHSGGDLLDAIVIGFEAAYRLAKAFDGARAEQRGPTHRGWWHVGVVGPMAAAMTVARLLKLDARTTATAIGIASCTAGGFRRNMGTMAKAFHSGAAARDGIDAVRLAQRGFTSDPELIEAPLGFLAAISDPDERDLLEITERLGAPFVLDGTPRIKPYPTCTPIQPVIEAALAVRRESGGAPAEIESVEADLKRFSLFRIEPVNEEEAGFSGKFLIAATLVDGALGLDQVCEEGVHDPRIKSLMERINHVAGAKAVTVHLKDGRTVGSDLKPVRRLTTIDEVGAKFRDCAGRALPPDAVELLYDLILDIENRPDIANLMACAGDARSEA